MNEQKVKGLSRVLEHEPLAGVLSGLKGGSDPYLMYQACYAYQTLQHIPDNGASLQAVMRHSAGVVNGLVKASDVIKLDLGSVLKGLGKLRRRFSKHGCDPHFNLRWSVLAAGEWSRSLDILKEGLGYGQKTSMVSRSASCLRSCSSRSTEGS
jgi:hypothetical protein